MNRTKNAKILAILALLNLGVIGSLNAQDDFGGDDVFNSDQIDIDGLYERKDTAADRIEKMRKKLEQRNEDMVQKKIEDIRIKQEKDLAGQLKSAFGGNGAIGSMNDDSVSTVQAAPQRVVAPVEIEEPQNDKTSRIIPRFGVKQFNNSSAFNALESDASFGAAFESMVNKNVSIGAGFNYTGMDITFYRNNDGNSYSNFNSQYIDSLYGDKVSYKNIELDVTGKVFLSSTSKVKPFVGLGLAFHRSTLSFEERNRTTTVDSTSPTRSRDTSVSGTGVNGSAIIGAEFDFNDTVGFSLDFRFSRVISNAFGDGSTVAGISEQDVLERSSLTRLGHDIENSDVASLNAGLVVKF